MLRTGQSIGRRPPQKQFAKSIDYLLQRRLDLYHPIAKTNI